MINGIHCMPGDVTGQLTRDCHMSCRHASSSLGAMHSKQVYWAVPKALVSIEKRWCSCMKQRTFLGWWTSCFSNLCPVAQVSSQFERCSVLFNIASLQSQIAKFQNFDSDEGLKNAAKHFQVGLLSSGCYCMGHLAVTN